MKKLRAVLAVCGVTALSTIGLAACGGSSDHELNGTYASFPDFMDPGLSYTSEGWNAMGEVYIPLLTYKHAEGAEGSEVVPGLAKAMPEITNGGKTYTLFLRPGLKYSDGEPVKASDFTFAVERVFRLNSSGSTFYTGIVGAERFAKKKQGGIAGIKADDKTGEIVIDLTKPRGTFTNELGLMFVAPLPPSTPNEDQSTNPPPATGPYVITKSQPGRGWEYERNPYWAKANSEAMPEYPSGHVDSAKMTVIRNPQSQVDDVEQGKYDWMQNPVPSSRYAEVRSKYDGTQFRVEPSISTYYFWMNMNAPPFDDLEVRQAVNYAVNEKALDRIYAGRLSSTQQILPVGIPGYEKFELYPYNLAKARRMIKEADPSDMDITVWTDAESPNNEAGEYYESVLREIGFNAHLRIISADNYFTVIGNRATPGLDTGWSDWYQDYPHPNDFFQPMLAGESIKETNNNNYANIDDPTLNKKIAALSEEALGPEQEAAYAKLDREYMEQAPWAPYGNFTLSTFVSDGINLEGVIFNPTFGQYLSSFEFK